MKNIKAIEENISDKWMDKSSKSKNIAYPKAVISLCEELEEFVRSKLEG